MVYPNSCSAIIYNKNNEYNIGKVKRMEVSNIISSALYLQSYSIKILTSHCSACITVHYIHACDCLSTLVTVQHVLQYTTYTLATA